ncbi:hypothetical protein EHS25_005406 [Saitozyma podzolica]|uniref:DUF676 domain-containing protein n=1 Tax=Saitozyma podzolica TaxID=1890683 RepID=A0A427XY93_9TREE|nr:hypothetical protein EHS25_005406 [Saitozyma podzolica]
MSQPTPIPFRHNTIVGRHLGAFFGAVLNPLIRAIYRALQVVYGVVGVHLPNSNATCPVLAYDIDASHPDSRPIYFRGGPAILLLRDACGAVWQVVLLVGSLAMTFSVLFVLGIMIFTVPACYIILLLIRWVQGGAIIHSKPTPNPDGRPHPRFDAEAWMFVNGMCTSKSGLQLIINYLHAHFGRPITGIYNCTYGFWFDLLECIIQRDFSIPTDDIRLGYSELFKRVSCDRIRRVVLMGHSQGGIIISTWVDQLLTDFADDLDKLKKVEIYTFASAANHFSGGPFARIEHFVNTLDFVSRIGKCLVCLTGAIHFAPDYDGIPPRPHGPIPMVRGRFAGRMFKRIGASGHLLLSHYLAPGSSILDDPVVKANSKLKDYEHGRGAA